MDQQRKDRAVLRAMGMGFEEIEVFGGYLIAKDTENHHRYHKIEEDGNIALEYKYEERDLAVLQAYKNVLFDEITSADVVKIDTEMYQVESFKPLAILLQSINLNKKGFKHLLLHKVFSLVSQGNGSWTLKLTTASSEIKIQVLKLTAHSLL